MGRQSSRLYYQGKDHKDIYFDGHYHDKMYIGSQLVWEKLTAAFKWTSYKNFPYSSSDIKYDANYSYYAVNKDSVVVYEQRVESDEGDYFLFSKITNYKEIVYSKIPASYSYEGSEEKYRYITVMFYRLFFFNQKWYALFQLSKALLSSSSSEKSYVLYSSDDGENWNEVKAIRLFTNGLECYFELAKYNYNMNIFANVNGKVFISIPLIFTGDETEESYKLQRNYISGAYESNDFEHFYSFGVKAQYYEDVWLIFPNLLLADVFYFDGNYHGGMTILEYFNSRQDYKYKSIAKCKTSDFKTFEETACSGVNYFFGDYCFTNVTGVLESRKITKDFDELYELTDIVKGETFSSSFYPNNSVSINMTFDLKSLIILYYMCVQDEKYIYARGYLDISVVEQIKLQKNEFTLNRQQVFIVINRKSYEVESILYYNNILNFENESDVTYGLVAYENYQSRPPLKLGNKIKFFAYTDQAGQIDTILEMEEK